MKCVYDKLMSLVRDEEGTEVVEWALAGGLIVAVGAAILSQIGDGAKAGLTSVKDVTDDLITTTTTTPSG